MYTSGLYGMPELIGSGGGVQGNRVRGNLCTARALCATFRLCSPRRAPKQTPWKRP